MDTINENIRKIYKSEVRIILGYSVIFFVSTVFVKMMIYIMGTNTLSSFLGAILFGLSAPVATICYILIVPIIIYALIKYIKVQNLNKQFNANQTKSDVEILEFKKFYNRINYINLFFILCVIAPLLYLVISNSK